jgi:hypothetical protein
MGNQKMSQVRIKEWDELRDSVWRNSRAIAKLEGQLKILIALVGVITAQGLIVIGLELLDRLGN